MIYCYAGGTVTINGGTLHVAPETYENEKHSYGMYFEEEYGDLRNGSCGYTLMAANSCKVSINGAEVNVQTVKVQYGTAAVAAFGRP